MVGFDPNEPPGVDPDNVPETLCIGKFNVMFGPGPLATLTFTHVRNKAGPLIDKGKVEQESVVRARIVTVAENMVALRDLLNAMLKDAPPTPGVTMSGSGKLN